MDACNYILFYIADPIFAQERYFYSIAKWGTVILQAIYNASAQNYRIWPREAMHAAIASYSKRYKHPWPHAWGYNIAN